MLLPNTLKSMVLTMLAFNAAVAKTNALSTQATTPSQLLIKKYQVQVNGKRVDLFRIEQPDGTWGYRGMKGEMFDVTVKNQTDKPTVLHWHGLIVPNNQDGVPYVTQPPIPAGGGYHYRFKLKQSGTYWMHSHHDLQVQQFLSAPLIIEDPNDVPSNKEVTVFIGDFSFKKPEVIFAELKKGNMPGMQHGNGMSGMPMKKQTATDLNDVAYDAFLTNYRTLKNPEVIQVKPGDKVRLRFIAGAAMTNFFINTGFLSGEAIAIDGEAIKPVKGNQFQLAVGQRLDVMVTIPVGVNAYPILAQGEGTKLQTGLILATPNAKIPLLNERAVSTAGALNYDQEFQFKAATPLPKKAPGQTLMVNLEGDMMRYVWTINNQVWPKINPLKVSDNQRVEMVFNNKTMMAHPMHLHGHVFEVTEIDGKKIDGGLLHDTVLVRPNSTVKVQFDTDNPGNWMLHCHMLYHQESGMMTIMSYSGVKVPALTMQHSTH
ncbi:multicopper oxidase family protein (plasmid) [Legionella sp. D16C41]|uniref:multicopper oxidase family protein n=1 Tax=Legionella sp. D16C41 TaxID=3402688 RepID=UPI003AF777D7